MKRRIGFIVFVTTTLLAGGSAALAIPGTTMSASRWGCVGVELVDKSYCVSNPLPERLPLPAADLPG